MLAAVAALIPLQAIATSMTYTATPGGTGGTYGGTGIPTVYYDETGNQLYDGDYGMWDWIIREQPSTTELYWANFVEQKGYAYPWVGWRDSATITIDSGTSCIFEQIGLHMYRGREIGAFDNITLTFSDDGLTYNRSASYGLAGKYDQYNDDVFWVSLPVQSVNARYARLDMSGGVWKFVDEMSVNNLDGASNPIPEPTTAVVFGAGLVGLLLLRRRRGA